mgnify:CR=1 FL=1
MSDTKINVPDYGRSAYESSSYGAYERKEDRTHFKPSPIISPIYGILDKNYRKEDVVTKKEVRLTSSYARENLSVEDVRKKAYGNLSDDIVKEIEVETPKATTPVSKVVVEEDVNLLVDLSDDEDKPSVKEVTMGDALEYFEDLGLEYNVDYVDSNNEEVVSELESVPVSSVEYKSISDGEYVTDKGYTLVVENGVAYIDDILIVNKTYSLPNSYKPVNPYNTVNGEKCVKCLEKDVMNAFNLMEADARSVGLNIYIASGYRSYTYQETLYNNYTMVSGVAGADTYSARAGHSEHQTGLCFDLNTIDDSFAYTDEGKWVNDNAWIYGFIIRYPKGKEHITGYNAEAWHFRYVGEEVAKNKIDILITVGKYSKYIAEKTQELNNNIKVKTFENNESASEYLLKILQKEDVVLLKASNSMKFSEILEKIK